MSARQAMARRVLVRNFCSIWTAPCSRYNSLASGTTYITPFQCTGTAYITPFPSTDSHSTTSWVKKKTRHQTLSHNFTNYYPIFKNFSLKGSVVNLQQTPFKNSTTLETCRYTTLWNINVTKWHHSEIRIAINDDSQGSIDNNLRCDE